MRNFYCIIGVVCNFYFCYLCVTGNLMLLELPSLFHPLLVPTIRDTPGLPISD